MYKLNKSLAYSDDQKKWLFLKFIYWFCRKLPKSCCCCFFFFLSKNRMISKNIEDQSPEHLKHSVLQLRVKWMSLLSNKTFRFITQCANNPNTHTRLRYCFISELHKSEYQVVCHKAGLILDFPYWFLYNSTQSLSY